MNNIKLPLIKSPGLTFRREKLEKIENNTLTNSEQKDNQITASPTFSGLKPESASQIILGPDDTPQGSLDMGFVGGNPNKSQSDIRNDTSYDGAVTFDRMKIDTHSVGPAHLSFENFVEST